MSRFIAAALTLVMAVGSASGQTFKKNAGTASRRGPTGTRRAVVVGISRYESIRPELKYADRDARALATFLLSPAGHIAPGNLRLLVNDSATAGNIYSAFDWLEASSQRGDEAIVYFAGHGDVQRGSGFLLAYNAHTGRYFDGGTLRLEDLERLFVGTEEDTGISHKGQVSVLLITDACRAGNLLGATPQAWQSTTAALMHSWGHVAKLVSNGPNELSHEGPQWGHGHGIFTYFLIAALSGRAKSNALGEVTLEEVGRFVQDSVAGDSVIVALGPGNGQFPVRNGDTRFPITWVDNSPQRLAVVSANSADAAAPAGPDPVVQASLAKFERALAARLLLDSAGAWDVYQRELAGTSEATDARFALVAALEERANAAIAEYLSGSTTQSSAAESRRAAIALERAAQLVGEKSIRSRKFLARQLFFEGYGDAQNRDYQTALQALGQSINLEPEPAYAYNARGFAFLADLQLDSAWANLTAARQRAPRLGYALLGMGLVALQNGDAPRALALIDSAAALQGPQVALQVARAITLLNLNRSADAATVFRTAATLEPDLKRAAYVPQALREMPDAVARLERLRALTR
ncbi:MAG TPA: caspase family protein [Gemmatimonadales bacterium]|nr:caspase family protein [Gemmatimonadales bacterium]